MGVWVVMQLIFSCVLKLSISSIIILKVYRPNINILLIWYFLCHWKFWLRNFSFCLHMCACHLIIMEFFPSDPLSNDIGVWELTYWGVHSITEWHYWSWGEEDNDRSRSSVDVISLVLLILLPFLILDSLFTLAFENSNADFFPNYFHQYLQGLLISIHINCDRMVSKLNSSVYDILSSLKLLVFPIFLFIYRGSYGWI